MLIDEYAPVKQIGWGFDFTEGPIWHPVDNFLLFSDMPGDVRRRWDNSGFRDYMRPSNKGNGMTYDKSLNLLVCEHSTSSVAKFSPDGQRTIIASHFEGQELNSPNDICVRSDGSIYFTDPWYGRMPGFGVERPRQLGWQGVFKIGLDQDPSCPQLLVERNLFSQPNGLCFSPDEKLLYINDTEQTNIRVFDVNDDGTITNGKIFAENIVHENLPGVPDGMKSDSAGNIWLTAPGGLWIYTPAGDLMGTISIPEKAANLAWGGEDWRTLFVCATTSVYAIQTKIGPRNEPFMKNMIEPIPIKEKDQKHSPEQSLTQDELKIDIKKCVLIVQDMQNDVVMEGGAFADSGSPIHCKEQRCVENIQRLIDQCRKIDVPIIHVWFLVEKGARGITRNAPLFDGVVETGALVEGTWGAAPVDGLQPNSKDFIVKKMRMSAWEGTNLETILKSQNRNIIIETGAWTNMSIEHTARTGADKGYRLIIPEDACSTMNGEWHKASINYALQNVSHVVKTDEVLRALNNN